MRAGIGHSLRSTTVGGIVLVAGFGCRGGEELRLAHATIDTLPGGIVRVTSPAPTGWTDTTGWRFVEAQRITSDEGGPAELVNPRSLAVDEAGRIYVADQTPEVVKVFLPDGRFLRTIGRDGEGPGEFRGAYIAAGHEKLVVHDPRLARTSVFDTSGAYERSWRSACCVWSRIILDPAGRIWIPVSIDAQGEAPRASHLRFTLKGEPVDTVYMPFREEGKSWEITINRGGVRHTFGDNVPLMPGVVSTVTPQGMVVHGWSGSYELAWGPTGLDTLRIIRRAWTPEPVTDARKREIVDERIRNSRTWMQGVDTADVRKAYRLEDIPSTAPAFGTVAADLEGNLFVGVGPDPRGRLRYDVFDSTGAWLGETVLPLDRSRLMVWGAGWVLAAIEDADGRPALVRLSRRR